MRFRRPSFAFYLGLLVAIFACSAAAAVAYVQVQSSRDARHQARADATFAADAAARQLGSDMSILRSTVRNLAANPAIAAVVTHPAGCSLTFGGPGEAREGHIDILRTDGAAMCSSRTRASDGTLRGYAGEPWLRAARKGEVFRAPVADRAAGGPVAVFAAPGPGRTIVAGFVGLRSLGHDLASVYSGNRPAEFVVTAPGGTVVARSLHPVSWIGKSDDGTAFARDTASARRDLDGVRRIYASAPVTGTSWRLFVGENEHQALASGVHLRNRELAILLTCLALVLLATIAIYRRMVVPMKRLSAAVQSTAAHGHEHPVEVSGPAEVHELAEEINALISSVNAHEAVRRAKEEAERANDAKTRFLSHMSHELRTPLAAILGFAELLHRGGEDEAERRKWSKYILDGGRHLLQLVNELLEVSRIEAGKTPLAIGPVDVRQAVGDVFDLVAPIAGDRSVRLVRDDGQPPARATLADPLRLKQVLLNLVSNAIKYNREGGTVTVSVADTGGGTVRFTVADTGQGIPEDKLQRLFRPFDRLGAEAGPVVGSGLGLVVTKGLVEAMGGRLEVESAVGRGTTFAFELPLEPVSTGVAAPARTVGRATGGDVLYIDDSEANLQFVQSVFGTERPGLELRMALEGETGAALAQERRPDLLLLDLNLPDMAGEEVLRRLRARAETVDVPVVIVSADSTSRNVTRLLQSGADAYLTKPLDVPQLLDVVDRLLPAR